MTLEEYRAMISHRSIHDSLIEEVVGVMTVKTTKKVWGSNDSGSFKQETQQKEEWIRLPVGDVGRKYYLSKTGEVKRDTGKNCKGKDIGYARLMQKPNKQGCIVITHGSNKIHINVKKIHEEYWGSDSDNNNNNTIKKIKIKEA